MISTLSLLIKMSKVFISHQRFLLIASLTLFHIGTPSGGGPGGGRAQATALSVKDTPPSSPSCPRPCFCNALSRIVYCSRRGLLQIPDGMPDGTLQLNLNGNIFKTSVVQRANFSRHFRLEHLYMSDCGLERIEIDSFVDLVNLKWLDVSDNRLTVISEATFRGLNLQHLFLNGNRAIQLFPNSFDGLATTGLYLHDCSLTRLPVEVLAPVNGTLGNLWLNGNQLDRVDRALASLFSTLTHLRLGTNPLRCNCEAVWLKEFYDKHLDVFKGADPPGCIAPAKLKGRHFGELSLTDFRCQSPAFSNIDALFDNSRGRLKCVATGDPTPVLYWIQPSGRAIKYNPPSSSVSSNALAPVGGSKEALLDDPEAGETRNEGLLILDNPSEVDGGAGLTGMYICVANNEAGNVTLTINVTWPHVHRLSDENNVAIAAATNKRTTLSVAEKIAALPLPILPRNLTDGYVLVDGALPPSTSTIAVAELSGSDGGVFTVTELVLAIIGTHLGTVLLALSCVVGYRWRHGRRRMKSDLEPSPQMQQQQHLLVLQQQQQKQLMLNQLLSRGLILDSIRQDEDRYSREANNEHYSSAICNNDSLGSYYTDPRDLLTNR